MAAFKVNITKNGNAIKFQFTDSDHYLYGNGEIEVPVNSLSLIVDESNMVTFRKANSNDIFLSFDPANSNLSDKAGVIEFYKTNMVGSTGGGGSESGITSGDVQTMIDNSLEDYYTDDEVDAALSGKADASDVSTLSGQVATKVNTTDFSAYSAATDARIAEDEEVTAAALNDLQENKADTSAVTAVQQSLSGKQDTLVSGTNIKTINNESILGSGNITISGGGGQSLAYYTEDTSNESATIMVQNDDGLGNRSEKRVFVNGGDIIIESYNETDDGEGNTGTTDTQVDINSLGLSIITYSDDGIDTTQTELKVQPMGAYINSEPIATEPYVDAAIDEAVSGKADTSAVTESINAAVSGKADTTYLNQIASQATDAITALTQTVSNNYNELTGQTSDLYVQKFGDVRYDSATHRINFYAHGNSTDILAYVDASAFIKDGMVSNVEISNGNLVITFNSDAGKQPISIPLTDIFNPANYYTTAQTQSYVSGFTYDKATIDQKVASGGTFDPDLYYDKTATDSLLAAKADTATTYTKTEVDNALSGKADTSAVTAVSDALTAHTSDTGIHVSAQEKNAWNAKAEPYSAGTGIEISGNVISATGGGGATYSAGTNISIDTANTINCTLNARNGTGSNSLIIGNQYTEVYGGYSLGIGERVMVGTGKSNSLAVGMQSNVYGSNAQAMGRNVVSNNDFEHSTGRYNNSTRTNTTFGNSGNTLLSVGNGHYQNGEHKHNALDIRQNGDLYFADTDNTTYQNFYDKPMVRLQDMYGALGGLKFVKLTQSEYDQLATKDPDTLYIITNVVS